MRCKQTIYNAHVTFVWVITLDYIQVRKQEGFTGQLIPRIFSKIYLLVRYSNKLQSL